MKVQIYEQRIIRHVILLLLIPGYCLSQEIEVEYRNTMVTATTICFEVWARSGANYPPSEGEWSTMNLRLQIDVETITPSPGPVTLGTTGVFSMYNASYMDVGTSTAQSSIPGVPVAPYDFEYGLFLRNSVSRNVLPSSFVRLVNVCIPVLNGTLTYDYDQSDLMALPFVCNTCGDGSFFNSPGSTRYETGFTEDMTPLPIELTGFEAVTHGCEVVLYWQTATERNLGYYQIEESKDGRVFKSLSQQKPQSANSTEARVYKYQIPAAYQDSYFRLKAVDLDGSYEYSPVVYAEGPCERKQYGMHLYPNPSYQSELTVEVLSPQAQEQVRWLLTDSFGKQMQQGKTDLKAGVNKFQVSVENLPSGTYYIQLIGVEELSVPLKFVRSNF